MIATGTGTTARTPVAVVREVESYTLTLKALDRDGKPTPHFMAKLGSYSYGAFDREQTIDPDGTVHLRAARGHYVLTTEVRRSNKSDDLVVAPWLDLSADRAITVHARTTKPAMVTVQRKNASLVFGTIGYVALPDKGGFIAQWMETPDLSVVGTAQIGPDAPEGRFTGAQ